MKQETFRDFLEDKHASDYMGLDDDMGEDYDNWVAELDDDELIDYGEVYGKQQFEAGQQADTTIKINK